MKNVGIGLVTITKQTPIYSEPCYVERHIDNVGHCANIERQMHCQFSQNDLIGNF